MAELCQYKNDFKYYKRKLPPPDYSKVLDFSIRKENNALRMLEVVNPDTGDYCHSLVSLMKPVSDWNVHELRETPGFLFIRNPFTEAGQRYWIYRCLRDFTCRPSKLNIDSHNVLNEHEDWWRACQGQDPQSLSLRKKLRWATMGYHHNWETKVYSETERDLFPGDLAELTRYIGCAVGVSKDFSAEAAIVNFYHFDSTLSGHTDHSEIDLSAPLFSFSFGQTAIFLLGGTSLDCTPTPIFIKSGDIVIMSGYSRKCYHGIPKIVPAEESPWDFDKTQQSADNLRVESYVTNDDCPCFHKQVMTDSDIAQSSMRKPCRINNEIVRNLFTGEVWKPFQAYISESRINMNVRQVLCRGETKVCNKSS